MRPTEREVSKVMHDTGMDRMQAYRHIQGRHAVIEIEAKKRRDRANEHSSHSVNPSRATTLGSDTLRPARPGGDSGEGDARPARHLLPEKNKP